MSVMRMPASGSFRSWLLMVAVAPVDLVSLVKLINLPSARMLQGMVNSFASAASRQLLSERGNCCIVGFDDGAPLGKG
jgi:hypothetical protein